MILSVEDLLMNFKHRTTIGVLYAMQHGHHGFVVLSILKSRRSLNILKNENLWGGMSNIVDAAVEDCAAAVIKAFSARVITGERLAWEAGNVPVGLRDGGIVPFHQIMVDGRSSR